MDTIIQKARILVEALPYIQRFRDAFIVVKYGGSTMDDRALMDSILTDVAFMAAVNMRPVVVHGGGKAISRRMKEAGLSARFVKGLRVTDAPAMAIVYDEIQNVLNPEIIRTLEEKGARARGIPGETIFQVVQKSEPDPKTGEMLNWGLVGDIRSVDPQPILDAWRDGILPVVTPIGRDADGQRYNLNADDAASAVAVALKARKLVFLSDVPGLLRNPEDERTIISTVRIRDVERLIQEGVIEGGMLPKIRSAADAILAGVAKVHLVDGRIPHSLLLEIYTDAGIGTEIIPND